MDDPRVTMDEPWMTHRRPMRFAIYYADGRAMVDPWRTRGRPMGDQLVNYTGGQDPPVAQ